jgi:hypothetical protein
LRYQGERGVLARLANPWQLVTFVTGILFLMWRFPGAVLPCKP